jgi:Fe-S cluster biosynthesis and repair protein YggX
MGRTVHCVKYGKAMEGLDNPPFPGEAGQRIFEQVSAHAWQDWLKLQTMLINEHRLMPFQARDKQFLAEQREQFLFGAGAAAPQGYVPPQG